jgi:hypothetical protein
MPKGVGDTGHYHIFIDPQKTARNLAVAGFGRACRTGSDEALGGQASERGTWRPRTGHCERQAGRAGSLAGSLDRQSEYDQPANNDHEGPTGNRDAAGEPCRTRRRRLDVPALHAANRDELKEHHVDSSNGDKRHFEPEHGVPEILGCPADEQERARDHRKHEGGPGERQDLL